MRRRAGSWLRYMRGRRLKQIDKTLRYGFASCALLFGILLGIWLQRLFPHWMSDALWLASLVLVVLGMAVIFALVAYVRKWKREEHPKLQKGTDAEIKVGQAIEFGVTMQDCAVAHNVRDIPKSGEIDHLVMTPGKIWVVETKSSRVPRKYFGEVLKKIASNVKAVREWAPPDTKVQGCLVLADGLEDTKDREYSKDSETILLEEPRTLMRTLRGEAGQRQGSHLARQVWKLGKI